MAGNAIEARSKSAVFTFGRFQPPTIGHKVLIDSLATHAAESESDAYAFVSSRVNDIAKYVKSQKYKKMQNTKTFESYEANENPLSVDQKIHWMQKMYPDTPVKIINTTVHECRTIFAVVDKLRAVGYTSLALMVGSDRVPTFAKMFEGHEDVTIVSAGTKRNDSNTPAGMSGTKMRQAAVRGDFAKFKQGVLIGSMTDADAKELMNQIRAGLGYDTVAGGGAKTRQQRRGTRKTRRNRTTIRILQSAERCIGPDGC